MKAGPAVQIIILNWNGYELTRDCLRSLAAIKRSDVGILVVDNGSTDGSVERLQVEFPAVEYLSLPENIGFAKGNNRGFESLQDDPPDFVIFLNNDTLVEPDFIDPLIQPLRYDELIGQTVPLIMYADQRDMIWYAGGLINFWSGFTYHRHIRKPLSSVHLTSGATDYATGCCFAMRNTDFDRLGGFDEAFAMYSEDADLSLRLRAGGKKVWLVPNVKIYHKVSASIGGAFSFSKLKRKSKGQWKLTLRHASPIQFITMFLFLPVRIIDGIIKYIRLR